VGGYYKQIYGDLQTYSIWLIVRGCFSHAQETAPSNGPPVAPFLLTKKTSHCSHTTPCFSGGGGFIHILAYNLYSDM